MEKLLTIGQAAQYAKCSVTAVKTALTSGKLRGQRAGRITIISELELNKWVINYKAEADERKAEKVKKMIASRDASASAFKQRVDGIEKKLDAIISHLGIS